jgi:hypothetical protein
MNFAPQGMARPFNDKGDFVIGNVAPGSYTLTATMNQDGKTTSARTQLDVGGSPIQGIALQLTPGAEIAGRIKIEGAQTDAKTPNLHVYLQTRSLMMYGPGAQGGLVKEDNSFILTNVQPEVYDIRVMGMPDGGYVRSIRFGDDDLTESSLDLTGGVPAGELSLVIAMAAGQLTGPVQNEKSEPATSGIVVLVPEGKRREVERFYQQTSTDQYGNYTLKNVAPGEYRLFAFDTIEYGSYQDPEWLKPFESKGERISVKENDKQTVQLKLVVTQDQAGTR